MPVRQQPETRTDEEPTVRCHRVESVTSGRSFIKQLSPQPLLTHPGLNGRFAFYTDKPGLTFDSVAERATEHQNTWRVSRLLADDVTLQERRANSTNCLQLIKKEDLEFALTYFIGPPGCGKTHAGLNINGTEGVTAVLIFDQDYHSDDHNDELTLELIKCVHRA